MIRYETVVPNNTVLRGELKAKKFSKDLRRF